MYLTGAPHPNRLLARALLHQLIAARQRPVTGAEVMQEIVHRLRAPLGLSARDALHVAVMEQHGIDHILTFDTAFDRWPGIERVPTGQA